MIPILTIPEHRWECPQCPNRETTREADPHTRFHLCPGLGGLTAPMVPEGSGARLVANEREDYVGNEMVQLDNTGRPIMSITTEHPDGRTDCVVFAPTATAGSSA